MRKPCSRVSWPCMCVASGEDSGKSLAARQARRRGRCMRCTRLQCQRAALQLGPSRCHQTSTRRGVCTQHRRGPALQRAGVCRVAGLGRGGVRACGGGRRPRQGAVWGGWVTPQDAACLNPALHLSPHPHEHHSTHKHTTSGLRLQLRPRLCPTCRCPWSPPPRTGPPWSLPTSPTTERLCACRMAPMMRTTL